MSQLVRLGTPPPSFADPVGFLRACHGKLADRIATVVRAAAVLDSNPEARGVLEETLRFLEMAVRRHHEDEELSVFPRISLTENRELLEALALDHHALDAIQGSVEKVAARWLTDPSPALATELGEHASTLADAYRDHMAREEADVFPLVAALSEPELRAIGLEMSIRRGELK